MRSYKRDLKTLKAKFPESPPPVEDLLTEDARHIHAFLVVTAQENGEELPTTTVEEIRAYLEHRENMTQEERREEIIRTHGRDTCKFGRRLRPLRGRRGLSAFLGTTIGNDSN